VKGLYSSIIGHGATGHRIRQDALRQAKIANDIVIARDGRQALDYLFAEGGEAGRDRSRMPAVVRADERTKLVPVVVLTSSSEEEDMVRSYTLGANSYVRKPVEFGAFATSVSQLGMYWMLFNQPPPAV
jgi:two-component system response regulator